MEQLDRSRVIRAVDPIAQEMDNPNHYRVFPRIFLASI